MDALQGRLKAPPSPKDKLSFSAHPPFFGRSYVQPVILNSSGKGPETRRQETDEMCVETEKIDKGKAEPGHL